MDVDQRIIQFISEELLLGTRQDGIFPEESLISSGILDSLALLRLILFLEEEFGVTIEDGEVRPENFETIEAMKSFLKQKRAT